MAKTRTIAFVIYSLQAGGAERVMAAIANYWAASGCHVIIITFDDGKETPFYELHSMVQHFPLGIAGESTTLTTRIRNTLRRVFILRRAIQRVRPEFVISFVDRTNIITLIATIGCKHRVIVSERGNPAKAGFGKFLESLRILTYLRAHRIIVQTRAVKEHFPMLLHPKIRVIPNPIAKVRSSPSNDTLRITRPFVTAMGRLKDEKGFDLLLHAFGKVAHRYPQWSMAIIGDGPSKADLEGLRDALGLTDRVHFVGRTNHPERILKKSDLFVLPSRHEGFPNALCEAMACGVAVIASDCLYGPRDIIRNGVDGILVPPEDAETLAARLDWLMGNARDRFALGSEAKYIVQRFGLNSVMKMWEAALN